MSAKGRTNKLCGVAYLEREGAVGDGIEEQSTAKVLSVDSGL